jgi:hypothetical protein
VVTDPLVKLAPWGHLLALGRSTGAGLHEAEILNDRGQLAFAGQREVKERSIKRHRIKIEDQRSSDSAFTASDLHVSPMPGRSGTRARSSWICSGSSRIASARSTYSSRSGSRRAGAG